MIGQKSVDEFVPLSRASDGSITTQFTMTTLEELGLLKMDFLGLRTLTVIQDAVNSLAEKSRRKAPLDMDDIDYNDKAGAGFHRNRKDRRRVPAGKRRDEELHEGAEATEPGGYHRRNFPVPSGPDGFYSAVYQGKESSGDASLMTARSWSRSWRRPTAVSFIRSRLCRSCGIWRAIRWDEAIWCAVPCPRKRAM